MVFGLHLHTKSDGGDAPAATKQGVKIEKKVAEPVQGQATGGSPGADGGIFGEFNFNGQKQQDMANPDGAFGAFNFTGECDDGSNKAGGGGTQAPPTGSPDKEDGSKSGGPQFGAFNFSGQDEASEAGGQAGQPAAGEAKPEGGDGFGTFNF